MTTGSMTGVIAAAAVSGVSTIGGLIVAAGSADPTAWTTGGIGTAAVGSLLYLIKRMTDGSLVSINVADLLADAKRRNEEAETREAKLRDVAKRGQDREDLLWGLLKGRGAVE